MVQKEIELLKKQLNAALNNGMCFSDVYELSVRLDKLIVKYYMEGNPYRIPKGIL